MLTRKIDTGLNAIACCRRHVPPLANCFPLGSPERTALDELLAVMARLDLALSGDAQPYGSLGESDGLHVQAP